MFKFNDTEIPEVDDEIDVAKFGKGVVAMYSEHDTYGGPAEMVVDFDDGISRRVSLDLYWTGERIDDGQDGEEFVYGRDDLELEYDDEA